MEQGERVGSARVLEATLLSRDIPIMDAGLKGRQVREFDSGSADTFDLRACLAFLDSFPRQPPGI